MGFPMRLHVTEHPPVALPEPVIAEMCHGARKVRAVRFLRGISSPSARKSLSQKAWMMVSLNFASWNQIHGWLRCLEELRGAA